MAPLLARAETVTLATGEKLEGKILQESGTDITLEIKVSSSINDERVISKQDIEKIEKVLPDETAYLEIRNFKTDPQTSFRPETYDRILEALKRFVAIYPASAHAAAVKQTLADFQAEKTRVDAGEVKFLGKWLNSAEAAKRKLQIDGRQAFDGMKYQSARQDWSGALNAFDSIEKNYSAARVYPDAVDLAVQILTNLQKQVADLQKVIAYNQDQFKKALERTKPEEAPKLRAGAKREQDQYAAAIAAAKRDGAKWVPFIPRSPESMNALQAAIPVELARLKAMPVQKMRASIGLSDDARAALDSRQTDDAASLIDEALKAWPKNDEALRCKEEITGLKKEQKQAAEKTNSQAATKEKAARDQAAAVAAAATTAKAADTPAPAEKPFYMTINGALAIAGGVIVLVGAMTLVGRLQKPKDRTE